MLSFELHKAFKNKGREVQVYCKAEFPSGSTSAIYGKSGVGKSTVLRMLAGLETPKKGFVRVGDEVWFDSANNINLSIADREPGFVFQDFNLFPNMSALRNLEYATKGPLTDEIKKLIEVVGLADLMGNYPHELSGGERQRVSIVRALCQQPRLLLLDEPFSALDDEAIGDLIRELKLIQEELGTTVLMISHRKDVIFEMADQVVNMKKLTDANQSVEGTVSQGKPEDILTKHF
ncbi:MAG: ATP-binding cassette domain-containing protein [Crocinitomicaceae bacterium]